MSLLSVLATEAHEPAQLIMPVWAFALIAAAFFVVVGIVTYTYRDVANRHSNRPLDETGDAHGHSH